MALRIDTAILKGELDNTERGRVVARLWLLGREEPVLLDLAGDPWRDIAGMKLHFVNRAEAKAQDSAAGLKPTQNGAVGDMTASRKVKVFTVPDEEWQEAYRQGRIHEVPTEWSNSLYLEWFSVEQGRCVVESADFDITIAQEPAWQMDEDEEAAQKMANLQAMRDYLAAIIQRREPAEDDEATGFTEDAWETQLKACDRLTDANLEAMDKYGEEEDAEEKTAFVMGWDHLLEERANAEEGLPPADRDNTKKKRNPEWIEMMNRACEEVAASEAGETDEDDGDDDEASHHPLYEFSHELVLRMVEELREAGLDEIRNDDRDHPLDRLLTHVLQISGKLAGALKSRHADSELDTGYALAISRRCLNWANEALAALDQVLALDEFAPHRELFEGYRGDLFKLREGITDLRREIRGE